MKNVKEVDGKKLHAAMIEEADKAIQGRGDGRISKADAKKIAAHLKTVDKELGAVTLQHIRENYKVTSTGQAHFDGLLGNTTPPKTKTITIDNTTPFYIKIFEKNGGNLGAFQQLVAPHRKKVFNIVIGQTYSANLAIDRIFHLKDFSSTTTTIEEASLLNIGSGDLKSCAVPEGMKTSKQLKWQAGLGKVSVSYIDESGKEGPVNINDDNGFDNIKSTSIYAYKATGDETNTLLGYFVNAAPLKVSNPMNPMDSNYFFSPIYQISPKNPNNSSSVAGTEYKRQSWFVPNYIQGTKTNDAEGGAYSIDFGRAKGRLTQKTAQGNYTVYKGLHLYTNEIAVFENENFNGGATGKFWIFKAGCNNIDAFIKTTSGVDPNGTKRSIKLGPGTMARLYDGVSKAGNELEIGCSKGTLEYKETPFNLKSFDLLNIEAPSSAGLTIYHELAEQHIPAGTYYRTTVAAKSFTPSKVSAKVKKDLADAHLKEGLPTILHIESSEPVEAIIYGKPKSLLINGKEQPQRNLEGKPISYTINPYDPKKTISIDFSALGQVQILIKPIDKSIRVPNLFFYTDKMDSSMRVMTDPNKQVHQRLATGQIQVGNFKPANGKLDIEAAASQTNSHGKGKLGDGLHKWLTTGKDKAKAQGQWSKIVAMTHKTNKAILHVHHKDAAGLHTHAHVDASHIDGFEDMHFSFDVQGKTSILKAVNPGAAPKKGRYKGFVGNKKVHRATSLKELSTWVNANNGTSSTALVASPENVFDDIWHGVTDVVMTIGHAIEEGVESALHFVVALGDKLCHLAISAADEIAAVLTKIYDTIKLAITDLINFIKFLIELLEDVGPMATAIANTVIDAVDYFDGKLSSFTKTGVQDFFKILAFPTPTSYTPSSSSNSDIDSAFEKFHWLMNLITQGAGGGKSGGSNTLAGDIYKAIFSEIEKLFKDTEALGVIIEDCFKDPKNADSILADFLAKLAGGLESPIEDLVADVVKGLSTSIKSTLTGDFPGLPSGVSSFLDKIGLDLSPAHVLGLLVALPSTMLYGIIKGDVPTPPSTFWQAPSSGNLALAATPQNSTQATFISAIGMITDLFAAVASPMTIVNAKGEGGDDSKFLALFSGLGKLAGSTISTITAATDWTGNKNALIYRDTMIGLSLFRGIWGIYAYKAGVPKTNCAIDMLLGSVKIACGVSMLTGDLKSTSNNTTKAIIQFSEGAGLLCELDGFVDLGGADAVFIGGAAIAPLVGSGAKLYLLAEA